MAFVTIVNPEGAEADVDESSLSVWLGLGWQIKVEADPEEAPEEDSDEAVPGEEAPEASE